MYSYQGLVNVSRIILILTKDLEIPYFLCVYAQKYHYCMWKNAKAKYNKNKQNLKGHED